MASPFDIRAADSMPLGSIIQSPINIERLTNGKWLRLDGRLISRTKVDSRIAEKHSGRFTMTLRSAVLVGSPAATHGAASTTRFVMANVNGTTCVQYSTNGTTWSTTGVNHGGGSSSCYGVIWAGSRFVMVTNNDGMYHTAGDDAGVSWTACTGDGSNPNPDRNPLAYSPSLGLTIMSPGGAGTAVYSLPDGSSVATTRTVTSSDKLGVVWTGQRFLCLTTTPGLVHVSDDGTSWSDITGFPNSSANLASNGAGTVVVITLTGASDVPIMVSTDHGTTWSAVQVPQLIGIGSYYTSGAGYTQRIAFVNGYFFITTSQYGMLVSKDGLTWDYVSILQSGITGTGFSTSTTTVLYMGGVYLLGGNGSGTTVATFTEDRSYLRLPQTQRTLGTTNAQMSVLHDNYMKVWN